MRLFKADLQEDGSFDEAIRGCDGVFHVSASMEFRVSSATQDLGNVYLPLSALFGGVYFRLTIHRLSI